MALTSPRWNTNARLQEAAGNRPPMRRNETGLAVRLVQQALIELGYPLPRSTERFGTPDGNFGSEVVSAIQRFQQAQSLMADGLAGRDTLHRMDQLLPNAGAALPPLPSMPSTSVNYTVPGLLVPIRQDSGMRCWAAMLAMMVSWRRQMSIPTRRAVEELGQPFLGYFDQDTGLGIERNRELAQRAGMIAQPLYNPSAHGWETLLRHHGLLWVSYAWQNGDRAGRHIIILHGIAGDGSAHGTRMSYIDPADGRFHRMSLAEWVGQHELGFTISSLNHSEEAGFSQIMHY